MKILGVKTAYRLTKQKVMTAISVVVVMGLCCVSAIAVDALLNFADVQALRVDPDDVIDYYDIPEEYAPDRENNGIKTPVTSDTKAAQKMNSNDQNATEPEETTSETVTETEEETTETEETSETTTETETTPEDTSETTAESSAKPTAKPASKPTETAFKKTVYARTTVNIRTGPGTSYKVVRKATMWQAINVVAKTSNGWYKTSDGNYVKQSLTTLSTPKPTATPKPKSKSTTKPTAKKTTTTTKKTTVTKVNGVKCKITFYGPVLYKRKDGSTFYSTTTATGTKCKQGRTCAADWKVFPKNSWIYIENDPLGGDGLYKVEDTGRFTGNWIDIYVDSAKGHSTCYRKVYQQ